MKRSLLLASMALCLTASTGPGYAANNFRFNLVRASTAPTCAPNAQATVTIHPQGEKETMHIEVWGFRPNVGLDVFVTQVPQAPFGMSWYQGDLVTDANGRGVVDFEGRFNKETFVIAPGAAPAPIVHPGDRNINPPTGGPIHTAHLGIWFNRPADAAAAGCPWTVTPFNGDHNAGVQVLNSKNFGPLNGPLLQVQ